MRSRPGCIESLLALARQRHVEVTYGLLRFRRRDRRDEIVGDGPPPRCERWGLQASLFHAGLRFVPLLYTDWLFGVPNDGAGESAAHRGALPCSWC